MLWPSADKQSYADLFTLESLEGALTTAGVRSPFVRLVRDGRPLPRESYTKVAHVGGERADGLLDPGRALRAVEDGATVVLQSLQRWWAPLAHFCRDLELALTHPVQANAYLTPPGATGLAPHHDTHDVFVLQVHGAKRWQVCEPVLEAPLPCQGSIAEQASGRPLLFEAELGPGDALYVPRGFVHSAQGQRGLSLHLTIGVLALTGHDVVRRVAERAAGALELRAALPPGWAHDPAAAAAAAAAAIESLARWLGSLDAAELAEDLRHQFWSNRPPVLDGQLHQLELLDQVDDDTVLRPRPGAVCQARIDGGCLTLALGDRSLRLPAAAHPAVARLLAGPLRLGELGGLLDGPSRLVLARRLVREGLLVAQDCAPLRGKPLT